VKYVHATAPNRRYADLATQRLIKAAYYNEPIPTTNAALEEIVQRSTSRQAVIAEAGSAVEKLVATVAMSQRIGQVFDATISRRRRGHIAVRLENLPIGGVLLSPPAHAEVDDPIRVRLIEADIALRELRFVEDRAHETPPHTDSASFAPVLSDLKGVVLIEVWVGFLGRTLLHLVGMGVNPERAVILMPPGQRPFLSREIKKSAESIYVGNARERSLFGALKFQRCWPMRRAKHFISFSREGKCH